MIGKIYVAKRDYLVCHGNVANWHSTMFLFFLILAHVRLFTVSNVLWGGGVRLPFDLSAGRPL